eukprot:5175479-Amphidinium_carterae.2
MEYLDCIEKSWHVSQCEGHVSRVCLFLDSIGAQEIRPGNTLVSACLSLLGLEKGISKMIHAAVTCTRGIQVGVERMKLLLDTCQRHACHGINSHMLRTRIPTRARIRASLTGNQHVPLLRGLVLK